MRKILFLSLLFAATMLSAQSPVELPLWPDGAPNTNGLTGEQEDLKGGRVANVTHPSITVYRPAKPNGMAVIMCPGGGYARLAMNHEGHDMAAWFTTQGITYAVLKYRMPTGTTRFPCRMPSKPSAWYANMPGNGVSTPTVSVSWEHPQADIWQLPLPRYTAATLPVPTSRYCSIPSSPC